jgi:hypothetical protein
VRFRDRFSRKVSVIHEVHAIADEKNVFTFCMHALPFPRFRLLTYLDLSPSEWILVIADTDEHVTDLAVINDRLLKAKRLD